MTLTEIQTAAKAGKIVHWRNDGYIVLLEVNPGIEQWYIVHTASGNCIGLTWADGATLNGYPEDFFISSQ